jgi:phage terminase Nu1 subunit (DNA packaging protein)
MSTLLEMEATDADLAALFDMTTRWVRDRAADGTITRIGRNRYPLGDSVQALIAYQTGGDLGEEINKARLRKLNADAARSELELATAKGQVAPIEQFERVWTNQCQLIQANMRRIPQRAVTQLIGETSERRFKEVLLSEIDMALRSAAEVTPQLEDENENADD